MLTKKDVPINQVKNSSCRKNYVLNSKYIYLFEYRIKLRRSAFKLDFLKNNGHELITLLTNKAYELVQFLEVRGF